MKKQGMVALLVIFGFFSNLLIPVTPAHLPASASPPGAQPTATVDPVLNADASEAAEAVSDCSDPVEAAIRIMQASAVYWNPLGYGVMKAAFIVGRNVAWHGGGYILMQSPKLTTALVLTGPAGMAKTVGQDLLVEITKSAIGTPGKACESIAEETIDTGLKEYDQAYAIARRYAANGALSREDALVFLEKRWGLFKLAAANELWNRARAAGESGRTGS